jgi:hypothetical protein
MAGSEKAPPFLGASAPWVDDEESTYEHVKHEMAAFLRTRLQARIALLDRTDLTTQEVIIELRRQMAGCAVDGNLMFAHELGEATWDLLQYKESAHAL